MIIGTIEIHADSDSCEGILEILSSVKGPTEVKSGCLSCVIQQEVNSGNHIIYEERWESLEHLYDHIRSDLFHNILVAIDMSSRPPAVNYSTTTSTAGMDLIEKVRGHGN